MKKLTLFVAAFAMSVASFAGKVTYELNGGVTNDYKYHNSTEMFVDFIHDFNVVKGGTEMSDSVALQPGQFYDLTYSADHNFAVEFIAVEANKAKWGWLFDYLLALGTETKGEDVTEVWNAVPGGQSYWRGAIDNFFFNGSINAGAWNQSVDCATTGVAAYERYAPYWKHAWCGPEEVEVGSIVTIPVAYKEGESFYAWYTDAALTQEVVDNVLIGTAEDVTLYAEFGAYINTTSEVKALEVGTKDVVTKGVVTYKSGKNVYIQDAFGGMLCYFSAAPDVAVAQEIRVKGELTTYQGMPELKNCELLKTKAAEPAGAPVVTIADILADTAKYVYQQVTIQGLKITKYNTSEKDGVTYNDPYASDGSNEIYIYINLDPTTYAIGKRISITAIPVLYNGAFQLVGYASNVSLAQAAATDPYQYPARTVTNVDGIDITYNFTSNWFYSYGMGNWNENKPNPTIEQCRGMVADDKYVYVAWFQSNNGGLGAGLSNDYRLKVYDAATGEKLDDIVLDENSAEKTEGAGAPFGFFCELKMDQAGHMVTNSLPTTGGDFVVWVLNDPQDKASYNEKGQLTGYKLISKTDADYTVVGGDTVAMTLLREEYPELDDIRFDRVGILGDVTKDARLFYVGQASQNVFWFQIKDGKWDGKTHYISCELPDNGYNFGYTPDIFPIEGDMFYVDGSNNAPILYDLDGAIYDSFFGDNQLLLTGIDGATIRSGEINGVREFEINGEYFLAMAGEGFAKNSGATSTLAIYVCADELRAFEEMTQLWEYPNAGFARGLNDPKNPQFVGVQSIVNNADGKSANVYGFFAEAGLCSYTLTMTGKDSAVENVETVCGNIQKVVENGQVYIIKDNVKYTVLGATVK